MKRLPVDQPERDQAANPRGSFHLEAPAGSGKTSVLLERFLTLLARVGSPEELLALTFTRKAAGELRTRVMQLFLAKEEPPGDASPLNRRLRDLAQKAFRRHIDKAGAVGLLERLKIMTFHSFCAQLLRLAPQDAGVPLEFKLLEENEARWLQQQAIEEMRRRLKARPVQDPVRRALVRRLVRLNNNWPRLEGELLDLLARRDSLGEFLELAAVSLEEDACQRLLTNRLERLVPATLKKLRGALAATGLGAAWRDFWVELQRQGAPLASSLPPQLPGTGPEDLPGWQAVAGALLTKQGESRKSLTPAYGFPPNFGKTPWAALIRDLPQPAVDRLRQIQGIHLTPTSPAEVSALQDLVLLLAGALGEYEARCARDRVLDFIALEQAALKLLEVDDPSDLLLRLDCRLKHLLVDEFQDTSESQLSLLCRLLAGWEAGAGRTLLVVGDPQQSIYGWRQAKLRLFLESRRGLNCGAAGTFPLEPFRLSTNFRASRTLIAWVNQVFGQAILADPEAQAGVEFHPAAPAPVALSGEKPRLALFSYAGNQGTAAREAEARWLAAQVSRAAAELRAGESLGILLFSRTHLKVYLQALHRAGLLVRVKEGLKLTDSLTVQHLHNLARALVRPGDDAAWAALLRAPWAGQTLATVSRVAQSPGSLWLEKLTGFSQGSLCPPELKEMVVALRAARVQVGRQPLEEVLQDFLEALGAWEGIAAREGVMGVANGRAYLELLAGADSGGPEATFLKADFDLEEAYQPPDPRSPESPVELLTVHGAKGLEFDWVFLPYLDWQPLRGEDKTPPFLLEEIPGTTLHDLALAPPYWQKRPGSHYQWLRLLKNQRVLAEARRLFYVAVTRAKQRLVLSGLIPEKKGGRAPSPLSPLGWLWEHYRPGPLFPDRPIVWTAPELEVELREDYPEPEAREPESAPLPAPWEFVPEAALYQIQFPSQLAVRDDLGGRADGGQPPPAVLERGGRLSSGPPGPLLQPDVNLAPVRGEVIHRLLETLSQGQDLPSAPGVAAALRQGGLAPDIALELAPEILAEVEACRDDPFLARLLQPAGPVALSEWRLEDRPSPGSLRRGVLDRLVFDGREWWLVDYKTSRPPQGLDWEEFISREVEKYRPQLLAYREMAAKAKGISPPEDLHLMIYFTACQRAVVVEDRRGF
ncbi:MAG: UvrD-helicase domain-containing protein [Thermodesulfobacteriota bacterium]